MSVPMDLKATPAFYALLAAAIAEVDLLSTISPFLPGGDDPRPGAVSAGCSPDAAGST